MKTFSRKNIISLLVLTLFTSALPASTKTSIYVSAHQDDWQLFMGVNAYNDIAESSDSGRVVIIYVTAGDYSDCANISDTATLPYFLAREKGAKNSVELAANSHKERFLWKNDTVIINRHLLIRSTYRYITCYFLRLADGAIDGLRNISLKNFRKNRFSDNYSIDSLAYYKDWNDLFSTCETVLQSEIRNSDEVSLNLFDTSQIINPVDHSDHYETAILFADVLKNAPIKRILYEGYSSGRINRSSNLDEADVIKESGLFAAYNQAMIDNGFPSIWNNDYIRFCDNNYFRIVSREQKIETAQHKMIIAVFVVLVLAVSLFFVHVLGRK